MKNTGGIPSCEKLDLLVLAIDQLVILKETLKTAPYVKVNSTYSAQLEKEREKLFQHEPTANRIGDQNVDKVVKQPDLVLQATQMLRPTPTSAVHLQNKFNAKEKTDAFILELSAMHPFGEPTFGWTPKKHLMTAVRLIDNAKKHKSRVG